MALLDNISGIGTKLTSALQSLMYGNMDLGLSLGSLTELSNMVNPNSYSYKYQEASSKEDKVDKTSDSSSVNIDTSFISPINDTDPWVRHDPSVGQSIVVEKLQPQDTNNAPDDEGNKPGANENVDLTRTNAIFYPIVKINTHNIRYESIIYMKIYYTGFVPTISIIIRDPNNILKSIDTPGLNNIITVVMIPETEGIYNTISIDFYITSCDTSNPNRIYYNGTYKFEPLTETKNTKQIKYPGCPNVIGRKGTNFEKGEETVSCNPEPNIFPNTWEYLHEIAKYTGLGFASTHQCREIQDRLPRRLQNLTYQEFIEKQILMSGVDEASMFDVWVDLYRYIVMVNVSWVMTKDITYKQLSIKAVTGAQGTDKEMFKARTKEVYRTLTNFNCMVEPSNLMFGENDLTQEVNNNVKQDGIYTDVPVFQVRGGAINNTGNTNMMNTSGVMAIEPSIDGNHLDNYRNDVMYRNTVQVDPYNTNYQKLIRKRFFDLRRSKRYILELSKTNFGLQRGTLINVIYMTNDTTVKQKIINNHSAIYKGSEDIKPDPFPYSDKNGKDKNDLLMNSSTQLPDPSKCGLFYIDGMTFEYSFEMGRIIQKLILIKKGTTTNLQNLHTTPKFDDEILGKPNPSGDNTPPANNTLNIIRIDPQKEKASIDIPTVELSPYDVLASSLESTFGSIKL